MSKKDNRPLSPHLQIYAWNISSLTSIAHRFSGILLYLSIVAVSWYVVLFTYNIDSGSAVASKESCDCWLTNLLGYVACFAVVGIILALYYHFCNGIRHLIWDIGKGYEIKTARKTGILVILLAILLTAATIGAIAYFKFM